MLNLSTERYDKIPPYLRSYQHCNSNDVGDEMQFLYYNIL